MRKPLIARFLAVIAGGIILAAVAHVTVTYTGGYDTPHAALTWAVAFGVGCGSVFCGMAWSARENVLALAFAASIFAGEAYNFLQTGDRLIAAIEAAQAPKREHVKAYAKAEADVRAADTSVKTPPAMSKRLEDANKAKAAVDQAITDKSAERGCREHCRELLQKAVTDAAEEVKAARAELEKSKASATTTLEKAKATLAGMGAPVSPTPFADNIGMPPWAFSLMVAALGSIGINGLACCLMVYGTHHPRHRTEKPRLLDRLFAHVRHQGPPAPAAAGSEAALPANVLTLRPRPKPRAPLPASTAIGDDEIDPNPVIKFMVERVPKAAGEDADWAEIMYALPAWWIEKGIKGEPPTPAQLGAILRFISEPHPETGKPGMRTRKRGGRVFFVDRKVIQGAVPVTRIG